MTESVHPSRAKLATRLAFVAAGFGVACWAPLVRIHEMNEQPLEPMNKAL